MPLSAPLVGQRRKGEKQMFRKRFERFEFLQVFQYIIQYVTLEIE